MLVTQFRAVCPELVELTAQIISNLRNRSLGKNVLCVFHDWVIILEFRRF